jgi:hypothetical protein
MALPWHHSKESKKIVCTVQVCSLHIKSCRSKDKTR